MVICSDPLCQSTAGCRGHSEPVRAVSETEKLIRNLTIAIRASVGCGPANPYTNMQLDLAIKELALALDARR